MFILAAVLCVPAPRDWSWDANGTCQGFGVHRAARGAGGGGGGSQGLAPPAVPVTLSGAWECRRAR